MSTEQAVIELVVAGAPQVEQTNEKIQADLTSLERAGKSAESGASAADKAAKQAAESARTLQAEVVKSLHQLHAAVALAERIATAAGVEPTSRTGQALEIGKDVIGAAATGAKLGSLIAPGVGTAVGASVGAIIGLAEGVHNNNKKLEELLKKQQGNGGNEVSDALLREAGLATLDNRISGGGRRAQ